VLLCSFGFRLSFELCLSFLLNTSDYGTVILNPGLRHAHLQTRDTPGGNKKPVITRIKRALCFSESYGKKCFYFFFFSVVSKANRAISSVERTTAIGAEAVIAIPIATE